VGEAVGAAGASRLSDPERRHMAATRVGLQLEAGCCAGVQVEGPAQSLVH